jgi:hypothetical protein
MAVCCVGSAYSPWYAADELLALWADGKAAEAHPKYDCEGLLKCVYCILYPSAYATLATIDVSDLKAIRRFWHTEWSAGGDSAPPSFWQELKAAAERCDYANLLRLLPPRARLRKPIASTQLRPPSSLALGSDFDN